jgi:hypothetical protein
VDKGMGFYNHVIHSNWGLAVTSVVVFRNFCFVAKVVIIHTYQDDVIIYIFFKRKKKWQSSLRRFSQVVAIIPRKI